MGYTLGIPSDGQSLGNSKPQVRGNFTELNTFLTVNHVALNELGQGKHKIVQMPDQGAHVTGAGECAIYGQMTGNGAFSNMVFQQESGGADPLRNQGARWMMTNIKPENAATGRSFLPGGMLMFWGTAFSQTPSGSSTVTRTVNYTQSGEGFTLLGVPSLPWIVLAAPSTTSGNVVITQSWAVGNYTTTTFDLNTVSWPNNTPFNYLIIGPKT